MSEPVTIGVLHPGEMGAAIAVSLTARGRTVLWASEGRSDGTRRRAERAGLADVVHVRALADESDLILSVCPPAAALEVAESVQGFHGVYVDANAISPQTAEMIATTVESGGATYVDGGIIGPPPSDDQPTRLYLAGAAAPSVAELFTSTPVDARVLTGPATAASALKMVFAAWTKGSAALLLAALATARSLGIEDDLRAEWAISVPELADRAESAARSASAKGWRWTAEMEDIASTFTAAGLPGGFLLAAADLFSRLPKDGDTALESVLRTLSSQSR